MKKNFICTKKSVRTSKLRIKPSFLSHAERGKTFWIREFLAGMRLCRRFAPTPFRLPIPIFNFGGGGRIRTSDTLSSIPLFESGAFNHSATPPSNKSISNLAGFPQIEKGGPKGTAPFLEWAFSFRERLRGFFWLFSTPGHV